MKEENKIQENKIDKKFLKPYDPLGTEENISKMWLESGFFNPDVCVAKGVADPQAETFSIVLPPPNVTGSLHIGHAAMLAIEDIVVRYHRMKGKRTLWLPGTDHAAIATQSKVEKILQKEKISKHDLGREKFLEKVDLFARNSHDTIVRQIQKVGSSVDWSREAFTLDETRHKAVYSAFKTMYDDGLIYQGDRIVNWDPKGQTTVADEEVEHINETTKFYYLKYGPFTIATSRPETKFGDKYVVMHPDDLRYSQYQHGQKIDLEWINGPITTTVIKDEVIDMEFGSGVMTITPWHDITDFEIGERHHLDKEQIIDSYGRLLPIAGEFAGMKITEAREKIIEKLSKKGLVEKIEDGYEHTIAVAQRTGGIIEPQIMRQWFIDVNKEFQLKESKMAGLKKGDTVTLKSLMRHVIQTEQIEIIPNRFNKVYFHWIDNLHDWCISRQIWYGHQIPAWYKNGQTFVGTEAPKEDGWKQDSDTLDTWFSSALWTFSTLGWPEKTEDLANYHPTDLMETGYDILFFWVARMILMSTYHLGEIPFKKVYLHGLVRDQNGKKMSKSLGNVIDPLDMSEKYGADAVRLSLIIGTGPGNDSKLSEDKIRAYKKFSNKIWNASRFVLENVDPQNLIDGELEKNSLTEIDAAHISEFQKVLTDIDGDITNYRFYLAAEKLYHYFWHTFADIIIEESKSALTGKDEEIKKSKQKMLYFILVTSLKALHPFIPFITEEIWQSLPQKDSELLLVAKWPIK